jgi:hypothetical protein
MIAEANRPSHASLGLRAGSWVVIRSQAEILATLDANGRLDGLPFQPEMLAFCGKRMRVAKSAHKTCDTINKTGGRKMERAYHLEGARCDGSLHGGCQADCVFFWKEDWLRADASAKEAAPDSAPQAAPAAASGPCTEATVRQRVVAPGQEGNPDPVWVCQTTALFDATGPLAWWDLRQYVKDVASGNHSAWHMAKLLTAASYRKLVSFGIGYRFLVGFYNAFQKVTGGKPYPLGAGPIPDGKPTPVGTLNLKVGELVQVKPVEEILPTLTKSGFNRGMRYDMEMAKYSGNTYKVEMLVDKLISETTGKMMIMKTPCVQLANVYCRAECTPMRLGCPRASNSYWREIWLRRVEEKKG